MPQGVPVLFFCIFAAISSEAVYCMGNYNKEAFPLTLIVLLLLLAAHFLPDISIAGHKLRKVDMLSDLRVKPAAETDAEIPAIDMEGLDAMLADSLPSDPLPSAVPAEPVVEERSHEQIISKHYLIPADTCPPGVTCIEDYSDSLGGIIHRGRHLHFRPAPTVSEEIRWQRGRLCGHDFQCGRLQAYGAA